VTGEEIWAALDGLYAYDMGSRGSGIHDEDLRARVMAEIKAIPLGPYEIVPRLWLSRLVREMWLSDEALAQGYGIEDALGFTKWLDEQMTWGLVF
jgi:hypothetical protein